MGLGAGIPLALFPSFYGQGQLLPLPTRHVATAAGIFIVLAIFLLAMIMPFGQALRMVGGLTILMVPGWMWSRLAFQPQEWLERIFFAVVFSLVAIPLALYSLNRAGLPIATWSVLLAIVTLTVAPGIIEKVAPAIFKRR